MRRRSTEFEASLGVDELLTTLYALTVQTFAQRITVSVVHRDPLLFDVINPTTIGRLADRLVLPELCRIEILEARDPLST